jgi:hypothetical protein
MEPASIRYKNPGAMWGNALAIKWGAQKKAVTLNDGKGQGNNIAVFPTYVQGICAQLDLWRISPNYKNKRFADAIAIWSGHNSVESYIAFVLKRIPGMTRDTIMNDVFWKSQMGIAFLKAQAGHEAGKIYPAPDADWIEAQRRVFSGVPTASTVRKAAASVTSGVVPAVAIGTQQGGIGFGAALLIGLGIALVVFLVWKFKPKAAAVQMIEDMPHPAIVNETPPPSDNAGSEQPK